MTLSSDIEQLLVAYQSVLGLGTASVHGRPSCNATPVCGVVVLHAILEATMMSEFSRGMVTCLLTCTAPSPHSIWFGNCREWPTLDVDSPIARLVSPQLLPIEANSSNSELSDQTQQALYATGQQQLASILSNLPHQGQQHAL